MSKIIKISPDAWQSKGKCELTGKIGMVHEIKISGVKILVNHEFYKDFQKIKKIVAKKKGSE